MPTGNNKAHNQPFGAEKCKYPFVQQNTVVSWEFTNSVNRLLGSDYDTELLLRYYHDSRLMYPNRKMIGNAYVHYKNKYMGIEKNPVKTRDMKFERDFNAVFDVWWRMRPIDFLRQYEAKHRAEVDDSGFENGLVLQGFLDGVISNHPEEKGEVNVVIINPAASFVAVLADMTIPAHVKINCCCLDDHIVGIYRSASELEKFQWSHIDELQLLESAAHVLFFATACPKESVGRILRELSALSNRSGNCTVRMVTPTPYMKSKKSFNIRSLILDNFSVHHVLVISGKATNIEPTTRCVITLKKESVEDVGFLQAKLITKRHRQYLQTGLVYLLPYSKFVASTKSLHGLYEEAFRAEHAVSEREQPECYHYSEEIKLWYSKKGRPREKFQVQAYFCEFPTADQTRKNTLNRGKRIGKFIYSKHLSTEEEVADFLKRCLLENETLRKNVCAAMDRKFHCSPISLKSFWYFWKAELMERSGYQHDFFEQLFEVVTGPEEPLYRIIVGESTADEVLAAVKEHTRIHRCSATYQRKLLLQFKQIWDLAYMKGTCADRPLQELLAEREARRDTYDSLRETSVTKSLSAEKVSELMESGKVNGDLRIKAVLSLKKDAKLTGAEIGALLWGDFIRTPVLNIHHLLISKRLPEKGTVATPFFAPHKNRCQALSTETVFVLKELRKEVLARAIAKGFTEKDLETMPMISKADDPQQGLIKNQINALSAEALNALNISELLLPLPENSQKDSTDLNEYGGDLFGAHLGYSLRMVAGATADELAYLSGNKLVTTVGTHYCDYLHPGRQLVLHRKLDRITDYNRREVEPFSPSVRSFMIVKPKRKLAIKTSAHRSAVSVEIDIPDDPNFVELVADCELRYGMDITANYFPDK